jgi:hypothetical protein
VEAISHFDFFFITGDGEVVGDVVVVAEGEVDVVDVGDVVDVVDVVGVVTDGFLDLWDFDFGLSATKF